MLVARREKHEDSVSFEELIEQMKKKAESEADQITAGVWDIFKSVLVADWPAEYNCKDAWKPGSHHYNCAATVSSLFSYFGIDIGKDLPRPKMDQNITPADFLHSKFFTQIDLG